MSRLCELAADRFGHASGALWLAASRTAIVADVHLGYGWAQRRRGELGPIADTQSGPRLTALVEELKPERLVFLGDLVHAPRPGGEERAAIEAILRQLAASVTIVLVRGNHDRAFARDFGHLGLQMAECWMGDGTSALHGDRLKKIAIPDGHLILGHLHPVLKVRDAAGASQKLRIFLLSKRVTVLPAFSPYSAGFEIARGLPADLRTLMGPGAVEGVAITGKRALRIGVLSQMQTNLAADLGPDRAAFRKQ